MKIFNCLLSICTAIVVDSATFGQGSDLQGKVDAYINAYVNNGDFSGNVLIIRNDKVLINKSYGKASEELGVKMFPAAKFRVASLSKTFTAAGIVLLEKVGKLHYTDKVNQYIPGFNHGDSITLQMLLLHQSGVGNIDYDKYVLDNLSLKEVTDLVKKAPSLFKPGTKSEYSNSGYVVLARLIELTSGKSYEQFLTEEIFEKLDMKETGVDHTARILQNMCTGYTAAAGATAIEKAAYYNIDLNTGSGSIYSTVGDIARWLKAVKNKTLFDINSLPYPYGWGKREYFENHKSIEQSGFLLGYSSYMTMYPADDLFIVALSNINSNFGANGGRDIAAICFGEKYNLPEARQNVKLKDVERFTGRYNWPGFKEFFIESKNGNLFWRFVDEKTPAPLAPVTENVFVLRLMGNKITFNSGGTGKATDLSFDGSGSTVVCKRIE